MVVVILANVRAVQFRVLEQGRKLFVMPGEPEVLPGAWKYVGFSDTTPDHALVLALLSERDRAAQ